MSGSREEALFALALEKPLENQITISDALCEGSQECGFLEFYSDAKFAAE
jgi:hypothetical protein